jgi:hypothetical protein
METIECNHVFVVKGFDLHCEKCGIHETIMNYRNDKTEFKECESGRCGVV